MPKRIEQIAYRSGYKYQLQARYTFDLPWLLTRGDPRAYNYYFEVGDGKLTIKKGYAWDGPSGPTIDSDNFMRGSLLHDALYQMIREGILPEEDRYKADNELRRICLEDGMSRFRAWYVYHAVRRFGKTAIKPRYTKYAPQGERWV